jgi:WD40 repeat protein
VRWDVPREIAVLATAFSGDGRLVTGSDDGASRTWNLRTGKDAGLTVHHDADPTWTAFGSNGSRIVTVATDGVARVWDVPMGGREDALKLAELAEAIGGHALDPAGGQDLRLRGGLAELRNRSARQPAGESFADALAHWLFADPATRTISPVSRITVPEYVARLRREGESGEREATRLFPWLSSGRR